MSVNVHIVGQRDPEGRISDMLDLKEQCDRLKADYPPQLVEYFKGTEALGKLPDDVIRLRIYI